MTYPTTASFPDPENTPLVVTWEFGEEGPRPWQVRRPEVELVADVRAPPGGVPWSGRSTVRVSAELSAELSAGGAVRATFHFRFAHRIRAFLDLELERLLQGKKPVGTEESRRAAWWAAESRATAAERGAWCSALRAFGLRVLELGELVPYVVVEGAAAAVRAALAARGLQSADVAHPREQEDAWGADILRLLGMNARGLASVTGLPPGESGDGIAVGVYEGMVFPYHPALASGPPSVQALVPAGCDSLAGAQDATRCRVEAGATRVTSVMDCSVYPCQERLGMWGQEVFAARLGYIPSADDAPGGHALGVAHIIAGDLTLGQDPWYEEKIGEPAPSAFVRRRGSGLLPRATVVSVSDDFKRASAVLASGARFVRTLNWSGSMGHDLRNPANYADGRIDALESAAELLYLAGISLVRSAGNDNGNFRLPTLDDLLAAVQGLIDRGVAIGRWVAPAPEVLYPWVGGATPARRMTLEEYRLDLRERKVILDDENEWVKVGVSRLDEFSDTTGYWKTIAELRIRAPEAALPDYCGVHPAADGTLPLRQPWCGSSYNHVWDGLVTVPTPCVPSVGTYCNDGVSTIDSPCGQTVVLAAAWNLDPISHWPPPAPAPGPAPYSSYGGAFVSAAGQRLARNGVSVAGLIHFARPAFPMRASMPFQAYKDGRGFGGTSGSTPTVSALIAALQKRLVDQWRSAWRAEAHEALVLTHPGLLHALLLALADGEGLHPTRVEAALIWSGLHRQLGAGLPMPRVVRWLLGERAAAEPRRVLSVGVMRRVRPGRSWGIPTPNVPVGATRLLRTSGALFFVDPAYAATGEHVTPCALELRAGASFGATVLARDDGRVIGLTDARSVENRRRVIAQWPHGRAVTEPRPQWRVQLPVAPVGVSDEQSLDVWFALIEEYR